MNRPTTPASTRRGFLSSIAAGTGVAVSCFAGEDSPGAGPAGPEGEQIAGTQANDHVIYHASDDAAMGRVMRGFPPLVEDRVTIDNYRARFPGGQRVSVANTRWAQFHMREILPTQTIRHGNGPVRGFPVKLRNVGQMRVPYGDDCLTVSEWLKRSHTDGFLILHDGVIVHEEYFHGMREDIPHALWSTTKSMAGCVVANLMALGKLDENRPITDYVPELLKTGYKGATVRHLLDMQSGVDFDYESPGDKNTWPRWERAAGLARKLPDEPPNEGLYDFMLRSDDIRRKVRTHGAYFFYNESDPQALAWACERVTKTRFSELISRLVWSKIGAEYDADMVCDPAGGPNPGGGLSATLRDLGRWGQCYLEGDPNAAVVPRPFVRDILSNFDPGKITEHSFPGPRFGQPPNYAYRSLHNVYQFPDENLISASGAYGQFCEVFPKRRMVFVKLSTYEFGELDEHFALTNRDQAAFRAIADQLARNAT
jgi:CubicO group peptidase (beta-lactamase class C family)